MGLAARDVSVTARLADVSVTLEPGAVTAICGPNGAGKSTLLQALAGLLTADGGEVLLDGVPLAHFPARERAQRIGYLPQSPEIAWDVPVRSLVALGRMPHGDRRDEPVEAALAALDLSEFADRRAQSLSGGETARVLLARVLAGEPLWILADEPLAALDLAHQQALIRYLTQQAEQGRGVALVLHDLAMAMNRADRVVLLQGGRVAADGPPDAALSAERIAQVFGVTGEWIGVPGRRAFSAIETAPDRPTRVS